MWNSSYSHMYTRVEIVVDAKAEIFVLAIAAIVAYAWEQIFAPVMDVIAAYVMK